MIENNTSGILRLLFPQGILSANSLVLLLSIFGSYIVINALYFLTLHPLAKIPGPKLCAATRLPYWMQNITGNDVKWMHELHTIYGPVVRFGPTDVSYASAAAWKDVHGHAKGQKEMEKTQDFTIQPVNGIFAAALLIQYR